MKKQNIVSWIALALSIIACVIAIVRIDVYFTNDTFVGIMAGFMGACATILVGVQIYNSIDTRNSMNKLNESFEEKIKEVESNYHKRIGEIQTLNNQLQYDLTELNKKLEQAKEERIANEKITEYYIDRARAIAFVSIQPFSSYVNLHKCLKDVLEMKNPKYISSVLKSMSAVISILERNVKYKKEINLAHMNKSKKLDFNTIKEYPLSNLIKDEYTQCHERLLKVIESIQPNQHI